MFRNFEAPDPRDFEEEFGVEVASDPNEAVHVIDFKEVAGEDLSFSYSTVQGSVRVQLRDSDQVAVVDIFREGATQLRIASGGGESSLVIEFGDRDSSGELKIQIFPRIKITDRLLFT